MYTEQQKDNFSKVANSLKKYRRADIIDDKGVSLIKEMYVDALPDNQVFKNCMQDNTTFLIGRKGTGKSTIFLRLEEEYKAKKEYISCYIDVKTLFESSLGEGTPEYLKNKIPEDVLNRYLLQRTFIQRILEEITKSLNTKYNSFINSVKKLCGFLKIEDVEEQLTLLLSKIKDNQILESIELPIFQEVESRIRKGAKSSIQEQNGFDGSLKTSTIGSDIFLNANSSESNVNEDCSEFEDSFSSIFIKIFQIKDIILEIKEILHKLGVRHLVIMLDDVSEIDKFAIQTFIDSVVTPLNNWSEEFIKFKIAVYPGRVHYGKIDKGKVDTIELDFYNLYKFNRDAMEERAIDFTKRLVENRVNYFCRENVDVYFDTRNDSMESYYKLLFETSMNIPRILGYILYNCLNSSIIYDNPINKRTIEQAVQKYYVDCIYPFFTKTTYSLMSYSNKVSVLQLKKLMELYINKMKDIKYKITTGELTSEIYDRTLPFTSHFNVIPALEPILSTLELNFFITKYGEMSDKDGRKVSIYAINYGLINKYSLRWGKKEGAAYRKYFIARPFDFTSDTQNFLEQTKQIRCTNIKCQQIFSYDDLYTFQMYGMKCPKCSSPLAITNIADELEDTLKQIDRSILLPEIEFSILYELNKRQTPVFAREIAEELDVSPQVISNKAKKMDKEKGLIVRNRNISPMTYELSEKSKKTYFSN